MKKQNNKDLESVEGKTHARSLPPANRMSKKHKGFWVWLFKKWYFWVAVVVHFFLSPKETGIIISLLSIAAFWAFIFWIIYLATGKHKQNKKDIQKENG